MRQVLARIAAAAPVPVFVVAGGGAREAVQDLALRPELRLVASPRHAGVLLIAGHLPQVLREPLAAVHDQLAYPRLTAWWPVAPDLRSAAAPLEPAIRVGADPASEIVSLHRELLSGVRESEEALLPDVDPEPWRGVGPYGQGGSGMTGGVPYGRPMAQLAPDRDGLRLDQLFVRIGPFFPRFPAGLVLDVKLSGDVVQEAALASIGLSDDGAGVGPPRPGLRPFLRALTEPVRIADLELTRAREHLRWLADALATHQLPALGLRALTLAQTAAPGDAPAIRRLARRVAWSQLFRWSIGGVGVLGADALRGLQAGPVCRAAGLAEDARLEEPAYRELGFAPIVHERGDAAARWRQRLEEAAQSLALAARAGERTVGPSSAVESPRGRLAPDSAPTDRLLARIPGLLEGLEWGDAVAALISLDLDLDEAAAVRSAGEVVRA